MVLWKVDALVAWTESSLGNGALESGCTGSRDGIIVGQWCSGKWMHCHGSMDRIIVGNGALESGFTGGKGALESGCTGSGRNHCWAMVLWKVDALVAWTQSSLGNDALESGCTGSMDGIIVGQWCSGKWMHW